jgi:hypothetical protein
MRETRVAKLVLISSHLSSTLMHISHQLWAGSNFAENFPATLAVIISSQLSCNSCSCSLPDNVLGARELRKLSCRLSILILVRSDALVLQFTRKEQNLTRPTYVSKAAARFRIIFSSYWFSKIRCFKNLTTDLVKFFWYFTIYTFRSSRYPMSAKQQSWTQVSSRRHDNFWTKTGTCFPLICLIVFSLIWSFELIKY